MLLPGCASTPPSVVHRVPHEVQVPVSVCAVPDLPAAPVLPVDTVADSATPSEMARALAASIVLLRARASALEAALADMAKPSSKAAAAGSGGGR